MQLIGRVAFVALLCTTSVYGTRSLKQSGCFFCDFMGSFGGLFNPVVPIYGRQSSASTCDSVWEVINSNDDLSIFAKAVKRAGFRGLLRDGVLSSTVFAPTNAAMKELLVALNATQKQLMQDPSLLPLISYHIINANIPMAALNNGDILDTLLGTNVTVVLPPSSSSGASRLPKPLANPSADAAASPDGAADGSADGSAADAAAAPDVSYDDAADASASGGAQAAAVTSAGTGVSARAPAPGPAGSILRKIFRVERSSAAAPQLAALDDGAADAAAAVAPLDAALQDSLNSLQSALTNLSTSMFQAGLNVSDAIFGAFNGSALASNRTLAAGQLRIRGAQTTASVVRADIMGCQGYVNIIDRVLFPEFLNQTNTNRSTTFLIGDGSGTKDPVVRFTFRRNNRGDVAGEGRSMHGGGMMGRSDDDDDSYDADVAAPSAAPTAAQATDTLPDAATAEDTSNAVAAAPYTAPLPVAAAEPLTPLPARVTSAPAPSVALGFEPLLEATVP